VRPRLQKGGDDAPDVKKLTAIVNGPCALSRAAKSSVVASACTHHARLVLAPLAEQ